eukprot:gene5770-7269_t
MTTNRRHSANSTFAISGVNDYSLEVRRNSGNKPLNKGDLNTNDVMHVNRHSNDKHFPNTVSNHRRENTYPVRSTRSHTVGTYRCINATHTSLQIPPDDDDDDDDDDESDCQFMEIRPLINYELNRPTAVVETAALNKLNEYLHVHSIWMDGCCSREGNRDDDVETFGCLSAPELAKWYRGDVRCMGWLANWCEDTQIHVLKKSPNVEAIITTLLNKCTSHRDFVAFSRRLIRLVIEAGINFLEMEDHAVETPSGQTFCGLKLVQEPCGISIMRAGEAMEQGLRESLLSIPMGHMLIQRDRDHPKKDPQIYFHHLPPQINKKPILLLDPIIDSGVTIVNALQILSREGARDSHIIIISLFASSSGLDRIVQEFPNVRVAVARLMDDCQSIAFSKRYFGT